VTVNGSLIGNHIIILPLTVCVHLLSNFCGDLRKTHHLCNSVRYGRPRSSKVVDFGSNRKGLWDFLLMINSNLGPISHRFWNTATYWFTISNCPCPLPSSTLGRGDPFESVETRLAMAKASLCPSVRHTLLPSLSKWHRLESRNLHCQVREGLCYQDL